jgi:hypothetical protein
MIETCSNSESTTSITLLNENNFNVDTIQEVLCKGRITPEKTKKNRNIIWGR